MLLTLLSYLIYPDWFINDLDLIDPWFYWGTAESPGYFLEHFPQTYYVRRWTIIAPGYIAQHLLNPTLAQAVLRGILLFILILFSAAVVRKATSKRLLGFLAQSLVLCSPFLIEAIGSSYVQGTGLVLTMICVYLAIGTEWLALRGGLFGGLGLGVLFGLLFVTYPWHAYVMLAICILVAFKIFSKVEANAFSRIAGVVRVALTGMLGFLAILVLDWFIGRWTGANWDDLITFSLSTSISLSNSGDWGVSFEDFYSQQLPSPASFVIPSVTLIATCSVLVKLKRPPAHVQHSNRIVWEYLTFLALFTLAFCFDPLTGGNPLMTYHVNVYLYLASLLALAMTFRLLWPVQSEQKYLNASILLCVFVFLAFGLTNFSLESPWNLVFALVAVLLSFVSRHLGQSHNFDASTLMKFAVVILTSTLLASTCATWSDHRMFELKAKSKTTALEALSSEMRSIFYLARHENRRIWALDMTHNGDWSYRISSMYGLYSALSVTKGPLPMCDQINWALATGRASVAIFGMNNLQDSKQLLVPLIGTCKPYRVTGEMWLNQDAIAWFDLEPGT